MSLIDDGIGDPDERMPVVGFKCDISESSNNAASNDHSRTTTTHKPSSSTTSAFVTTDQTWDAFLASLDDSKNHQAPQQGEAGTLDSSVIAADSDTVHGQLLLDLDGHHQQHRLHHERDPPPHITTTTCRLGPTMSPSMTSLEDVSSGMFMFDHDDDEWYGDESGGLGVGRSISGGVGGGSSSGTCPSDAMVMEGFSFPVVPDGSSTLSYALG